MTAAGINGLESSDGCAIVVGALVIPIVGVRRLEL